MKTATRALAGLFVLSAVTIGCTASRETTAGDEPEVEESTATTVPPEATGDGRCSTALSSPGQFAASGQYAVYLTAVDVGEGRIGFDVIQFLGGAAATAAYQRDNPGDPDGPPNDYSIVNESTQIREAPVAHPVRVRLVRLREDGDADLDPGTFDELPAYLSPDQPDGTYLSLSPFWLTLAGGTVTDICEQYVP